MWLNLSHIIWSVVVLGSHESEKICLSSDGWQRQQLKCSCDTRQQKHITNKTLKWAETRFKWEKKVGRVKKKIMTLVFQNIWMTWEKYTKSKKHKELCALLLLRMENRCFKEGDPFGDSRGPDEVNKVVGVLRRSCRCNGPFCWSLEVLVCIYEIPGDSSGPEEFFAPLSMT